MNHIDPSDKQGYYIFAFSMGFTLLFMCYLSFFYHGVVLDAPDLPPEAEQLIEEVSE